MLQVARYGKTRFWALWDGQDLVAVVVYKKGAAELLRRLAAQPRATADAEAAQEVATRQAQELAAQARALARQARAAAQAARARAQPAG
jgi:hypothetical protein